MEQYCSTYFSSSPATWKFHGFTQNCPIQFGDKQVQEQAWQENLKKIVQEADGLRKRKAKHLLKRIEQTGKMQEPSNVCPINRNTDLVLSRIQTIGYLNNQCVTMYKGCLQKVLNYTSPLGFNYLPAS
jgi:hypothetical protein